MKHNPCFIRISGLAAACVLALAAGVSVAGPAGVSPGAVDRISTIRAQCPTFSWEAVEGAAMYELITYRLPDDRQKLVDLVVEPSDTEEVLYTRVPGGATSWTPELERCLAAGGSYVWFVRAVFDEVDGAVMDAGEWSEGRFFAVTAAPSVEEVEHALAVLRLYLGEDGSGGTPLKRRHETNNGNHENNWQQASELPDSPDRSVLTAPAAIRGAMADPGGELYGVVGITGSADGAGVAVANTTGGADLVLDGSAQGLVDTEFSESGIDRRSSTLQTFDITNSGAGSLRLQVDGVRVVTTATDKDTLGDLSCGADEVAKWTGSSWACAPDEDSAPRAAGNQLSLVGNTLGVVEGAGSGLDADALDGHDSSWFAYVSHHHDGRYYTQTELNTSGAGGAVHWSNLTGVPGGFADGIDNETSYSFGAGLMVDNGQVLIDPDAFRTRVSVPDSAGDVGQFSSVAIGADGLGLISYYDVTNGDLKVAHCDDVLCTDATITTLDGTSDVGQYTSVAIGTDGLGLISYYDVANGNLKVAHCDDVTCTSGTVTVLDSIGDVGRHTSVAIGADGRGLIAYTKPSAADQLRVAHCSDISCTAAFISALDNSASFSSLAIGADGLGLVSYFHEGDGALKAAHCTNTICSGSTLSVLEEDISLRPVGRYCSLAIGADDLGLISYLGAADELRIAHCIDVECTAVVFPTVAVEPGSPDDTWTSIAVGENGRVLVGYRGSSGNELKVARCNDVGCTSVSPTSAMRGGSTIVPGSLAIGADGLGLLTYYEYDAYLGGDLKVAHLPLGL